MELSQGKKIIARSQDARHARLDLGLAHTKELFSKDQFQRQLRLSLMEPAGPEKKRKGRINHKEKYGRKRSQTQATCQGYVTKQPYRSIMALKLGPG